MTEPSAAAVSSPIRRGTAEFRRTNLALFAAGWSTFALIYCVQPLMPLFSRAFGVDPATSSLTVSATTGFLAVTLLIAGALSESYGRKGIMSLSLALSALLTIASAFVPNFTVLIVLRAAMGVAIAGIPAIAMAYLSEEIEAQSLGYAMGLFIAGSALGGMSGRLLAAVLADFVSWRWAVGGTGVIGLCCALLFWRSLPDSRRFRSRPLSFASLVRAYGSHLVDPGLPWLFFLGFLLMGSFVTLYNYIQYRLTAPPFGLSQTTVGVLFSVYLIGIVASTLAGSLADRFGRRRVLWVMIVILLAGVLMTRADGLFLIVLGVAVMTFGFFAAHSVASSWIGRRALHSKAQASSLYLFFYYIGSSVVGSSAGVIWAGAGWNGIVWLLVGMQAVALLVALRMAVLKPLPIPEVVQPPPAAGV